MDVARLNFSHGAHADHATAYRAGPGGLGLAPGTPSPILADLQGPKIRLGTFADGPVDVADRRQVCITVEDVLGTAERVSTTYKNLADDVRVGDRLLVDDGKLALTVVRSRARTSSAWSSRAARSPTTRASPCPASP